MKKIGICLHCDKPGIIVCFGPGGFDDEPIFFCDDHLPENKDNKMMFIGNKKTKCTTHFFACDCREEKIHTLLRKIEWKGACDYSIGIPTCPCCGKRKDVPGDFGQGHAEDCELKEILNESARRLS